jgi:hypothetical protein
VDYSKELFKIYSLITSNLLINDLSLITLISFLQIQLIFIMLLTQHKKNSWKICNIVEGISGFFIKKTTYKIIGFSVLQAFWINCSEKTEETFRTIACVFPFNFNVSLIKFDSRQYDNSRLKIENWISISGKRVSIWFSCLF